MSRHFYIFMLAVILLLPGVISSQENFEDTDSSSEYSDFEEIEEIDDFVEVSAEKPGYTEIFGRLHSAVVHFPIAWMMLLLLIELVAFIENKNSWHKAGFYILILTLVSFIPAVISGLINAASHPPNPDQVSVMMLHRNLNFIVVALSLIALTMRLMKRKSTLGKLRAVYLGIILIATILLMLSSHLGGKMVFGESYLPF